MTNENTHCPAARLAQEAARIVVARDAADQARDQAFDRLQDRLDSIADAVSHMRASAPLGVFFQALLIDAEMDPQSNWLANGEDLEQMVRRMRRLIASIASWAEASVDQETADILRSYYASRDLDALAMVDHYLARAAA